MPPEDLELPSLCQLADRSSMSAELRFLRCAAAILGCVVLAAGCATVRLRASNNSIVIGPLAGAALLAASLFITLFLAHDRPDRRWYDGRAVAESVKTLAWQYAVAGGSFSFAAQHSNASELFVERLRTITESRPEFRFGATPDAPSSQITASMTALREAPAPARRSVYRTLRLADQRSWYGAKAEWNERRASQWLAASLALQGIGLTGGVLAGVESVDFDFLGVAAAGVAAVAAWLQTRDHALLAEAYSVTAGEIALIETRADTLPEGEEVWGEFVADAEQAISREHTLWLARRGSVRFPR